jgi:hypothetical protein
VPGHEKADLVLTGGAVYTVNPRQPWASAVACGTAASCTWAADKGARPYTGPNTRVINLKGRMVLPGFIDSHLHPSGGLSLSQVKLEQVFNRQEVARRISAYAGANPQAPWVLGRGWEAGAFKPSGIPDRHLLDSLVPDRPAFLSASDGHTGWANTKALALAGITRATPDRVNGMMPLTRSGVARVMPPGAGLSSWPSRVPVGGRQEGRPVGHQRIEQVAVGDARGLKGTSLPAPAQYPRRLRVGPGVRTYPPGHFLPVKDLFQLHLRKTQAARRVQVRVDEARQHHAALQGDDPRTGAGVGPGSFVAPTYTMRPSRTATAVAQGWRELTVYTAPPVSTRSACSVAGTAAARGRTAGPGAGWAKARKRRRNSRQVVTNLVMEWGRRRVGKPGEDSG